MSVPEFDSHSKTYSKDIERAIAMSGQTHDFFVRSKAETLLPALALIDKDISKLKILDVGCGVGLVHRYIAGAVGELHGTDISGASLDVGRAANSDVFYKIYDGHTLPYADGSFDCAYAICVMHHVPEEHWVRFLTEMRRVVRAGGLILVIEHNPLNPLTQWVVRTAPMDANAVLLGSGTLRRLMKVAGIAPLWVQYLLFTPFGGKAFRVLDRLLSRVPLGAQYAVAGKV